MFALTRQKLSSCTVREPFSGVVITLSKSNFWKIYMAELHSNANVVWRFTSFSCMFEETWGLRSGDETVVGNRRLHLLESSGTSIACFSFCRPKEMKLWSLIFRAQAWQSRSDLIFLDQFPISEILYALRPWKRFCMRMFKFSEWDLEQTTTKSTIIVYTSLDSSFAAIEQTPHRIVLFW